MKNYFQIVVYAQPQQNEFVYNFHKNKFAKMLIRKKNCLVTSLAADKKQWTTKFKAS